MAFQIPRSPAVAMLYSLLEQRIQRILHAATHSGWYVPVVSIMATLSTLSMVIPFTSVLVPAVLLRPRIWRRIWWFGSAGSALGSSLLVLVFHHLGWATLYQHFPEMAASPAWQQVTGWVEAHGLLALAAVAALPLPQTPALIFCSITNQPLAGVALAMLCGKLVKYGVVAAVVAQFPERFLPLLNRQDTASR